VRCTELRLGHNMLNGDVCIYEIRATSRTTWAEVRNLDDIT